MSELLTSDKIRELAAEIAYPATPDLARPVMIQLRTGRQSLRRWGRPLAVALGVFVALLALLFVVPTSRALLLNWLHVGAVTIQLVQPEVEPDYLGAYPSLRRHETTLAAATAASAEPLLLPADYRAPDQIFWQELAAAEPEGGVTIFVWVDELGEPELSLYQIDVAHYGVKQAVTPGFLQTTVGPHTAFWVPGPHELLLADSQVTAWRLVAGNVLVWTDERRTFRLESRWNLAESVAFAERLR